MIKRKVKKNGFANLLVIIFCMIFIICGCKANETPEERSAEEQLPEGLESIYGDASLGIDASVDQQLKDYRLIALFGIDNGNRNDIEMIISLNKNTGEAKIVSIIRDTYMQVSESTEDTLAEFNRCNVAYERGGKYEAMKILNRNLDLNIRECICVDWDCTAKLIDALGGLECDIESQDMLEAINSLIQSWPEGDQELIQGTGKQTLSGWQAVHYLRVRKYHGGNTIIRAKHNRDVFLQLYNQAKSMSVEEIAGIYEQIADDIDTNMSRNTLTDTLAEIATVDIEGMDSYPYEWKQMINSEDFDYRVPLSLLSDVKRLHYELFDQDEYMPSTTLQTINDEMIEAEKGLDDK